MDIFGNKKPVQIETQEWWYNGRIIREQTDSRLPRWISFADDDLSTVTVEIHSSKQDAIKYAQENPCVLPTNMPNEYL